ncbi:MAG: hypothetical protein KIS81_06995 [Maricaulaceae bacterium]|nr:hypothetical protein [Maricaulaceae bacterium]
MIRSLIAGVCAALVFTGLTASAWSFTHGAVAQGIAFFWPTLAFLLALGVIAPAFKAGKGA